MNAHRLRTFLTMLGIIIGIASVVLVVALGAGSQEKVLENISSIGTNTISIRAGTGFGDRRASAIDTLMPGRCHGAGQPALCRLGLARGQCQREAGLPVDLDGGAGAGGQQRLFRPCRL